MWRVLNCINGIFMIHKYHISVAMHCITLLNFFIETFIKKEMSNVVLPFLLCVVLCTIYVGLLVIGCGNEFFMIKDPSM